MADRPIVILHGWSDTPESFLPLAKLLREELNTRNVSIITLANYITMQDEVRFDDLVTAMQRAWEDHGLPIAKGSVDAIVHSTGGLVIRDWLQRNFAVDHAPIKHLLMIAPANFGSPLAHKGRSFFGRFWKGFVRKPREGKYFETGTHILKGLELASPYSWQLALRDRFGEGGTMYQPGNVLCTVLVGNAGYSGIRSIANEDGSDGTVRASTANMECARITAEFAANPQVEGHDVDYKFEGSSGLTAFGIVDSFNHSEIKLEDSKTLSQLDRTDRNRELFEKMVRALSVTDEAFPVWREELASSNYELLTEAATNGEPSNHGFQNTVVRVEDQYGAGVEDYFLEFYELQDEQETVAQLIHASVIRNVHKYCDDHSYRSIYIDYTRLLEAIDKVGEYLSISLTAYPHIGDHSPVGFKTLGLNDIGGIRIRQSEIEKFFAPHRTVLVTLKLVRQQLPDVFRFEDLAYESPMLEDTTEAETPGDSSIALPEEVDTIVVPARKKGFTEVFIGEDCWYAIRIAKDKLKKIQYIAAYQTRPVSKVTHYAKVRQIEPYGKTGKYKLVFAERAVAIGPIPLGRAPRQAMQGIRYTSLARLKKAEKLDEIFPPK